MSKPKLKYKLLLLMCIAVISFCLVALAQAYVRPNNPTMDYVPQNYGIYDTRYSEFKESDCRVCHGTTTAWRHHATEYAVSGQCTTTCHDPIYNPYTDLERDCKECHVDGTWVNVKGGLLGFPHHRSGLSGTGICTACHDPTLVSDLNAVEPPQFEPTDITPKPISCENCHWPTGLNPHDPPPLADWNLWTSFPKPTNWPDSLPHPAPIEANGPVTSGVLNASKAYRPVYGTEHMAEGTVFTNCGWCHGTIPGGGYQTDPTNPYAIRSCENCHDIYTLHDGIGQEHTTQGIGGLGLGGYTIDGVLNRIVTQDQKCVACHGDTVTGPMPTLPVVAPIIDYLEPPMASAGAEVTIYDQAGGANFGTQGPDDRVALQQGLSGLITAYVSSWQPDKIVFQVPGAIFAPGFVNVVVQKKYWIEVNSDPGGNNDTICDPGESCTQINQNSIAPGGGFYLRQHPILNSLAPDGGTWGTIVTINGVTSSFFSQREQIYNKNFGACGPLETCYGYSTYVELVASNDMYRAIEMSGDGWSALAPYTHNSIQIEIRQLPVAPSNPLYAYGTLRDYRPPVDYFVPLADLYKGNWQLYVITDYFKKNIPGDTSPYMLKHVSGHLTGQIDPNSTVLHREISDPLPFFSTEQPKIFSRTPSSIKAGSLGAVYGVNFGTTQDTSKIYVTKCNGSLIPGLDLQVVQWANTRVIFRAIRADGITPLPIGGGGTGCIMVRVPKAASTDSNLSDGIWFYP